MATTPSEGGATPADAATADDGERRLHPLSWLFVLISQLRPLIVPGVVLVVLGRGDWWELAALVGAVGVGLHALVYSKGFRYRLGDGELVVREGIFNRTVRHIPFHRVQNVVQRRNPLHRLFRVTEVRLESAGGSKPEAVMNVITDAEAERLQAVLRAQPGTAAAAAGEEEAHELLALGPGDLLRLGLVAQRGMVVVGAAFAFAMQIEPLRDWVIVFHKGVIDSVIRGDGATGRDGVSMAVGAAGLLLAAVAALQLLSVGRAFVAFHRFRLRRSGEQISTAAGLLTRQVASSRRAKIQRLLAGESWLARRLGRRWLSCEVAAGVQAGGEDKVVRLKWLAPVATPERVAAIVAEVAPGTDLGALRWRPLHPRAARRMLRPRLVWAALLTLVLALVVRQPLPVLAVLAVLVAWAVAGARGRARFASYACDRGVFAVRDGWLRRDWVLAAIGKGQALRLVISPFDRRAGMASVELDTAGAAPLGPPLRAVYLAEADARALAAELRAGL
jgi:putative membrane protein